MSALQEACLCQIRFGSGKTFFHPCPKSFRPYPSHRPDMGKKQTGHPDTPSPISRNPSCGIHFAGKHYKDLALFRIFAFKTL